MLSSVTTTSAVYVQRLLLSYLYITLRQSLYILELNRRRLRFMSNSRDPSRRHVELIYLFVFLYFIHLHTYTFLSTVFFFFLIFNLWRHTFFERPMRLSSEPPIFNAFFMLTIIVVIIYIKSKTQQSISNPHRIIPWRYTRTI